jgi:hypothetical protein
LVDAELKDEGWILRVDIDSMVISTTTKLDRTQYQPSAGLGFTINRSPQALPGQDVLIYNSGAGVSFVVIENNESYIVTDATSDPTGIFSDYQFLHTFTYRKLPLSKY